MKSSTSMMTRPMRPASGSPPEGAARQPAPDSPREIVGPVGSGAQRRPRRARRHRGDAGWRRPEQSGFPAESDRGDREGGGSCRSRRRPAGRSQGTGFKKIQSRIANGVRNAILRDGTRDTGCGLKAFRREVFLAMPYFDGLHRFLPALVRREGYEIAYVESPIGRAIPACRITASSIGYGSKSWISQACGG